MKAIITVTQQQEIEGDALKEHLCLGITKLKTQPRFKHGEFIVTIHGQVAMVTGVYIQPAGQHWDYDNNRHRQMAATWAYQACVTAHGHVNTFVEKGLLPYTEANHKRAEKAWQNRETKRKAAEAEKASKRKAEKV